MVTPAFTCFLLNSFNLQCKCFWCVVVVVVLIHVPEMRLLKSNRRIEETETKKGRRPVLLFSAVELHSGDTSCSV